MGRSPLACIFRHQVDDLLPYQRLRHHLLYACQARFQAHQDPVALAQECERPEVIVVDDGSTDATPRILGSYGPDIKVLRQSNRGPSAARNAGAAAASPEAEYFTFLDADDVLLPGMLKTLTDELDGAA